MSLELNKTKSPYILIVNHPELLKKANELGYKDVVLFEKDSFDENDIANIDKMGKPIVRVIYCPDNEMEYFFETSKIGKRYIDLVTFPLSGTELEEGKGIESVENAVKNFPSKSELEKILKREAVIDETDYADRCGNCHEHMDLNDKYCRYCGTERGKGKFLPYKNEMYCVYGPPVKNKYKCSKCGHIWITGKLGGDRVNFCPLCRGKRIDNIESKVLGDFSMVIGKEEPYDVSERPVLFSEEEVRTILSRRKSARRRKSGQNFYADSDEILASMRAAGLDVPEKMDYKTYPRTEKQGEQYNLAQEILSVTGKNINGYKGIHCDYCGNNIVAAILYTIWGEDFSKDFYAVGKIGSLLFDDNNTIYYDSDNFEDKKIDCPAYKCLRCGSEFGKLEIPPKADKLRSRKK